jgi:hypothetical protein
MAAIVLADFTLLNRNTKKWKTSPFIGKLF